MKRKKEKPQPWKKQPKGLPRWVKSIPPTGSHGSGHLQKRLYRLVSDTVRIRDWYKFKGLCIATGTRIPHWSAGDGGHFISYSICRGMMKFDIKNIHLQSKHSNMLSTREDWQQFEAELIRRYGIQYLNDLEDENKRTPLKFSTQDILDLMSKLLEDMKKLPEQPEYWARAYELRSQDTQNPS